MKVRFSVNGADVALDVEPGRRLLDILNEDLGLTGPRAGCGVGRCGACVILLDGRPVNACLILAPKLDGGSVVTVEGLGARAERVRRALAEAGAVQCGYCASGLVTTLTWLTEGRLVVDLEAAEDLLAGQICRCTGYGGLRRALAMLSS